MGPAQGGQAKQVRVWVVLDRSGEEREEREGENPALHHVGAGDWFLKSSLNQETDFPTGTHLGVEGRRLLRGLWAC